MSSESRTEILLSRLQPSNRLDRDDIAAVRSLPIQHKEVGSRQSLISYGDRPRECCLLLEGFMARSITLDDGERQILSIHIPGDIPDLMSLHTGIVDHDLQTLTRCTVGLLPHDALRKITAERPNVAAAMWRETLIESAMFRQWIVNVGRRDGISRLAHLITELRFRLAAIGRANGAFVLPITQTDLADCMGLSAVHANRLIQQLRHDGIIKINRLECEILDQARLEMIAGFDPLYLLSPR